MTVKCTPASITVEVPTDAVTLDAETVSALLDGSADRTTLARVRDLITPRTVTIPEGTRVRLKVNPGGYPGFLCSMRGWDNDDVTVAHVTNREVLIRSALAQDYTLYAGPFEKSLDVLGVLEDKSPDRAELAQAREVLADCATTLESYARHHAERGPEHAHKVTRNAELAARCRAALAAKE